MTAKPPAKFVFILDLDQVDGVLLVDLGQAEDVRCRRGIGGIDPIEKGLLVAKDQGCAIEHDLGTGIMAAIWIEPGLRNDVFTTSAIRARPGNSPPLDPFGQA